MKAHTWVPDMDLVSSYLNPVQSISGFMKSTLVAVSAFGSMGKSMIYQLHKVGANTIKEGESPFKK